MHTAIINKPLSGQVPISLHNASHLLRTSLRGDCVGGTIPRAHAVVDLLFQTRPDVRRILTVLKCLVYRTHKAIILNLVYPLDEEVIQSEGVFLVVQKCEELTGRSSSRFF